MHSLYKKKEYSKYFNRQSKYFNEVLLLSNNKHKLKESKLLVKNSRILLLGLGGIGSNLAIGLAQSGIKEIILCDFDTVEPSNINRTLGYSFKDIGKSKCIVLKNYIENHYPWCNITTINQRVLTSNDIKNILKAIGKIDILVNCIDKPFNIKNIISDICILNDIPFIKGGYHKNYGGIGPFFIPKKSGCQRCFDKTLFPGKYKNEKMKISSSNPWLTQIISSLLLSEIIGFVSQVYKPQLLNKYLQFNSLSYEISKIKIVYSEYCTFCNYIPNPYSRIY